MSCLRILFFFTRWRFWTFFGIPILLLFFVLGFLSNQDFVRKTFSNRNRLRFPLMLADSGSAYHGVRKYRAGGPRNLTATSSPTRSGVDTTPTWESFPASQNVNKTGGDGAVRLLCWVLTDPVDLMKRTIHVRNTWAKRCDVTLFMSSTENKTFPTIGLNVTQGRNHIAAKSRAAWTYIYEHYYDQADYFVKTDPDTYMIVDNLKAYLKDFSPNKPQFFGHIFHVRSWGFPYMAGGPGIVLSRESVKRLVTQAFPNRTKDCMPDGQGEDWKTGRCLFSAGCEAVDTRDEKGRERFIVFSLITHIKGLFPKWYFTYDKNGAISGKDKCCSEYPISFHYIKPDDMYTLDYMFYKAKLASDTGRNRTSQTTP